MRANKSSQVIGAEQISFDVHSITDIRGNATEYERRYSPLPIPILDKQMCLFGVCLTFVWHLFGICVCGFRGLKHAHSWRTRSIVLERDGKQVLEERYCSSSSITQC